MLIRPAAPGTGVIAGGSIRTVLELAGIKNVLAKRLGSKTPLNNARAAMVALSQLRTHKSASRERGISSNSFILKNYDYNFKYTKFKYWF